MINSWQKPLAHLLQQRHWRLLQQCGGMAHGLQSLETHFNLDTTSRSPSNGLGSFRPGQPGPQQHQQSLHQPRTLVLSKLTHTVCSCPKTKKKQLRVKNWTVIGTNSLNLSRNEQESTWINIQSEPQFHHAKFGVFMTSPAARVEHKSKPPRHSAQLRKQPRGLAEAVSEQSAVQFHIRGVQESPVPKDQKMEDWNKQ